MNVACERPLPFDCIGENRVAHLCQSSGAYEKGIHSHSHSHCRTYNKTAHCEKTQTHWGISRRTPGSIFVLNSAQQETDRIRVRLGEDYTAMPEDIWYDEQTGLLYLVTATSIYRLNRNGDLLGAFMSAPKGTEYRAVCTFKNFVFVAAFKNSCLSLFSYTKEGAYLEQVSLGGGFSACSLQAFAQPNNACIYVFTTRDYRFPVLLEVELAQEKAYDQENENEKEKEKEKENAKKEGSENEFPKIEGGIFSVECINEAPEIRSTCTIQTTK